MTVMTFFEVSADGYMASSVCALTGELAVKGKDTFALLARFADVVVPGVMVLRVGRPVYRGADDVVLLAEASLGGLLL